jgi:hypothetical protein
MPISQKHIATVSLSPNNTSPPQTIQSSCTSSTPLTNRNTKPGMELPPNKQKLK